LTARSDKVEGLLGPAELETLAGLPIAGLYEDFFHALRFVYRIRLP
jgi:hypothetical protein